MDIWPGRPYPLGATLDALGTNFAVFSAAASPGAVCLCLFADDDTETRLPLTANSGSVWHGYVPGVGAGQRYGFRVSAPWDPARGHWANSAKLLLDPYALAVDGTFDGHPSTVTHQLADRLSPDRRDSAAHVGRGVVVDPAFDWDTDKPPGHSMRDSIIYETHVRGISCRHPDVPGHQKGTFAGLASAPIVAHLTGLGVTAVELMPVHQFAPEPRLVAQGLTDYWGYTTIGYFAPHGGYASTGTRGQQVAEFKTMVKTLHAAGIEVILDVVFNHTAEQAPHNQTLAFRGFDNLAYYRVKADDPSSYVDFTGTGNTLAAGRREVLRLVTASLRYWVTEMHVDGFRFDLAPTLARQVRAVDRLATFFHLVDQDPVISQVKLIAEPWDAGADGYQLGAFPYPWSEWNDRFRDGVRDFWRGAADVGELATRLAGSSDVFEPEERPPQSSVNFVTAHDGFTLADLVSFADKHNHANLENNEDGTDDNRSANAGIEGPTQDPAIVASRLQQQRNFLATLLVSQGVPMILGGDEIGRTQGGNNNSYCQDSTTSWYDWGLAQTRLDLRTFTARVVALRTAHPVLRQGHFLTGQPRRPGAGADVSWLGSDGLPMPDAAWTSASMLAMVLNGHALVDTDSEGVPLTDDTLLIVINGSNQDRQFQLPPWGQGKSWISVLDTATATGAPIAGDGADPAGMAVPVAARSLQVLKQSPYNGTAFTSGK